MGRRGRGHVPHMQAQYDSLCGVVGMCKGRQGECPRSWPKNAGTDTKIRRGRGVKGGGWLDGWGGSGGRLRKHTARERKGGTVRASRQRGKMCAAKCWLFCFVGWTSSGPPDKGQVVGRARHAPTSRWLEDTVSTYPPLGRAATHVGGLPPTYTRRHGVTWAHRTRPCGPRHTPRIRRRGSRDCVSMGTASEIEPPPEFFGGAV